MMAADVHVRLSLSAAVFCLILSVPSVGSEGSLYSSEDPIVILSADNFYSAVPRSQTAWFIEFYSSWCGHCIRFAPTWKALGQEISGWNGVMQVAGVDCAQEVNLALCRDFNIEAYPTLKFMNAFSDKKDHGTVYTGEREVNDLKEAVIHFLQNITDEGSRPPTLPRLAPLKSIEDIWSDVTSSVKHTAVIFEEVDSYLGRELLLDFAPRTDLVFRRMVREHVSKFGIREFPSLFLIEREGTFRKIADHKDRAGFQKALNDVLGVKSDKDQNDLLQQGDLGKSSKVNPLQTNQVYLADIESGLHYSLRQEIAGHTDISGQKLEALKSYLGVLAKYFPGSEPVVRYLKLIAAWIQQEKGPLSGATWLQSINHKQSKDANLTSTIDWVCCQGSSAKYRGYPCSLWTIFHTLTVNAVLDAGHMEDFDPLEVLAAMREYIKHFFGCRECSGHFQKMAAGLQKEVVTGDDAILWLWRAHNKANKRLQGDLTEDPQHRKIQFPSSTQCPECHTLHRGKDVFDEAQVLKFLKSVYSRAEIVQRDGSTERNARKNDLIRFAKSRQERNLQRVNAIKKTYNQQLDEEGVEQRVGKLREAEFESRHSTHVYTSWGLNTVDISMCVLFYIVCSGILILVYFHLAHNHKINLKQCIKWPC